MAQRFTTTDDQTKEVLNLNINDPDFDFLKANGKGLSF